MPYDKRNTNQGSGPYSQSKDSGTVICQSCGASFAASESACPYCGTTYIPAAQRRYMEKLRDVRKDLEDLEDYGDAETTKEIARSGMRAGRILIIALCAIALIAAAGVFYARSRRTDDRKEYHWKRETWPKWQALYEEEDYDTLADEYLKAQDEDHEAWEWDHASFVHRYMVIRDAENTLAYYKKERGTYDASYDLKELLNAYWTLYGTAYDETMSEADRQKIENLAAPVMEEIEPMFPMTEEERTAFEEDIRKHAAYVGYDLCEQYIKTHAEELGIK